MFVLISDLNVVTSGLQLNTDSFTKTFVVGCKGQL
jgi:hypothetical protein